MNWIEAVVLGIVQGLTEFLPISSTGHVRVIPALFGWQDPGAAFSAVIQLGTMAAVLIYFQRDIRRITAAWVIGLWNKDVRRTPDSIAGWYIALGTIPVVVFGFAFRHQISSGARSLTIVAAALVVGGVLMLVVDRIAKLERTIESLNRRDAIIIGFAQALALIPGVSRSGSTIVMGMLVGFDRTTAARFSVLLSIPAVVLSGLFELKDVGDGGGPAWGMTIVGTLFAFAIGYASIAFLLRYLVRHSLAAFAVYRIAFGILILVLAAAGTIR